MMRQAMEVDETFGGECASEKREPVPTGEQLHFKGTGRAR